MNALSWVISAAFIVLFGYFVVRIGSAIGGNLARGFFLRRQFQERLAALPLQRALEYAGMDTTLYLHDKPMHEIENELRNCEGCQVTAACDAALLTARPLESFDFCPNYERLFKAKSVSLRND